VGGERGGRGEDISGCRGGHYTVAIPFPEIPVSAIPLQGGCFVSCRNCLCVEAFPAIPVSAIPLHGGCFETQAWGEKTSAKG